LLSNSESLIVDGSNLVRAGRDCRHGKEEKCNKPGVVRRLSQLFEEAEEWKRVRKAMVGSVTFEPTIPGVK